MIEFDCEGCGVHVVDLGSVEVRPSRLCGTCDFLCENVRDPDEFWSAYQRVRLVLRLDERGATS